MSLLALQRDFQRHLVDAPGQIDRWIAVPAPGLAIYHNAYRAQLVECLAETYAQTHAWLGGEAFLAAMREHIERTAPSGWTLGAYGDGFAQTLATLYPDDPEIAELATLEWLLSRAFEASDADAMPPGAIAGIDWDKAVLGFAPSMQTASARTNAGAIWSALVAGAAPPAAAPLDEARDDAGLAAELHAMFPHDRAGRTSRDRASRGGRRLCRSLRHVGRGAGRGARIDAGRADARAVVRRWIDRRGLHEGNIMRLIAPLSLCLLLATSASAAPSAERQVVVELYQSQGCSSCPPADAVLNALAARSDVIALNFAVTYWDQLGWKDTFAKPAFTARQWDYARSGGRANVSTPQMIVGGRTAIVGSRPAEVDAVVARARAGQTGPAILVSGSTIVIPAGKPAVAATLWLVRYDPRTIQVAIRAGENGGRTIPHRNIVRDLAPLGTWSGGAKRFNLPATVPGMRTALILQAGRGGAIISARGV